MKSGIDSNRQEKKIRVLFFIPWMGGGGAERTFLNIVNTIEREKFEPLLILCRKRGDFLDILSKDTRVFYLNLRLRYSMIPLAQKISKIAPDIVISTMRFVNLFSVLTGKLFHLKPKFIVRETNNLTAAGINPSHILERLVGWSYRSADRVVSLSNGVKYDMVQRYGLSPEQITTIYNPVDIRQIRKLARQEPEAVEGIPAEHQKGVFNIIGVGSLFHQKGFDLLIRAVSRLRDLPIHLTILGEGPARGALMKLIRELGLEDRAILPGFKKNPYAFMARSDLFVLSSRWEGFGHVIVEAMACGVPVLSTRCPSGPDEIITDGVDGCLCRPNSDEDVAHQISRLFKNPDIRKQYIDSARQVAIRFDAETIVKQYEKLFMATV
jgi:glycosyltransferase involved in cell wall biosynthesis